MKTAKITIEIRVPDDAEYVAIDADGEVCVSAEKIRFPDNGCWQPSDWPRFVDEAEVTNWKNTVTKV